MTPRRRGAALKDERIMPVEYSPLSTSTPSTPATSIDRVTPLSPTWRSRSVAGTPGRDSCVRSWSTTKGVKSAEKPASRRKTRAKHQTVERSVRSLIHSERIRRGSVGRPVVTGAGA